MVVVAVTAMASWLQSLGILPWVAVPLCVCLLLVLLNENHVKVKLPQETEASSNSSSASPGVDTSLRTLSWTFNDDALEKHYVSERFRNSYYPLTFLLTVAVLASTTAAVLRPLLRQFAVMANTCRALLIASRCCTNLSPRCVPTLQRITDQQPLHTAKAQQPCPTSAATPARTGRRSTSAARPSPSRSRRRATRSRA